MVKNLAANVQNIQNVDSIPGSGRYLKEELATWASCLQNPRGGWQATVHKITKSWKRLKRLCMHAGTVGLQCGLTFISDLLLENYLARYDREKNTCSGLG